MDRLDPKDLLPGDVLLYHGEGLVARLIRFFDGTEVNHAALHLGDGQVGEALAQGLTQQSLEKSTAGSGFVVARRLKAYPETMEPVTAKARAYLELGNLYAFDQLLLLAFLGLTRKLPVSPSLQGLLRKILDQAASWLTLQGERQPMICSEFVYRCYDEALPGDVDPYALEVSPFPRGMRKCLWRAQPDREAFFGWGVHPESLLFWAQDAFTRRSRRGGNVLLMGWKKRAARIPRRPLSIEEGEMAALSLEGLGERYLEEVKQLHPRPRSLAASLRSPEMLEGITRFALAWQRAAQSPRERKRKGTKALPEEPEIPAALAFLWETAADFVTPGDLWKCQDLFSVGKLQIEEE